MRHCFLTLLFLQLSFNVNSQENSLCLDVKTCLSEFEQVNVPFEVKRPCPKKQGQGNQTFQVKLEEAQRPTGEMANASENSNDVKWWKLTLVGIGLAPIEFFISTTIHESAHALLAKMFGAEITSFKPYPHTDKEGNFYFGSVTWRGYLTPNEKAIALMAPQVIDTAVLGTYGGLVLTDSLPKNKYAQLGIWVFAAGHWVDMANHMIPKGGRSDSDKFVKYLQNQHGLSSTQSQLLLRGSQALVLGAGGYFLYEGAKKMFSKDENKKLEKGIKVAPNIGGDSVGLTVQGVF